MSHELTRCCYCGQEIIWIYKVGESWPSTYDYSCDCKKNNTRELNFDKAYREIKEQLDGKTNDK